MKIDVGLETMQRAFRIHFGRRRRIVGVILAILGVALLILGLYALRLGYRFEGWLGVVVGAVVLLAVIMMPMLLRRWLRNQLNQMRYDPSAVELTLDDDHLLFKTDVSESRIRWASFVKWREADGLILAYHHNNFFNVLPVEQMSEADASRVRQSLTGACGPSR